MSDYIKLNWSSKYKTFQLYDLSKRIFRYLDELKCLKTFEFFFGERADFQWEGLSQLSILQNMHTLGKIASAFLTQTYPVELCAVVFMEGCCHLVPWPDFTQGYGDCGASVGASDMQSMSEYINSWGQ